MKIEVKNVTKSFEYPVLQDFSCVFQGLGVHCVLGESGCGKSTLLKLLGGVWTPDSGEILRPKGEKVSFLFQEDRLLPWLTAKENVMAVQEDEVLCQFLFCHLGLQGAEGLYPQEMSGGMRRRTALVRSLAYGGGIFLWDEPFTGLDWVRKQSMMEWLKPLLQKKFCVFITHDREEALFLGEFIYTMEKNKLSSMERNPAQN